MDDQSAHPIPHELQASVDMEAMFKTPLTVAEEQKLQASIGSLQGVESLNFLGTRLAIRYDPELVHKTDLCKLIAQAGCQIDDVDSASASPAFDSHTEPPSPPPA